MKTNSIFKAGKTYKTVSGNDAKVIAILSDGRLLVHVYSRLGSYMDKEHKYAANGHYWSENSTSYDDLVAA